MIYIPGTYTQAISLPISDRISKTKYEERISLRKQGEPSATHDHRPTDKHEKFQVPRAPNISVIFL